MNAQCPILSLGGVVSNEGFPQAEDLGVLMWDWVPIWVPKAGNNKDPTTVHYSDHKTWGHMGTVFLFLNLEILAQLDI